MKKRLLVLCCVLVSVLGLSVSAFAMGVAGDDAYTRISGLIDNGDGLYSLDFNFSEETLASADYQKFVEVMDEYAAASPGRTVLFSWRDAGISSGNVYIGVFDTDEFYCKRASSTSSSIQVGVNGGDSCLITVNRGEPYDTLSVQKEFYMSYGLSSEAYYWGLGVEDLPILGNPMYLDKIHTLQINDNGGEDEPEPPSSSEESSSPSFPSLPQPSPPQEQGKQDKLYWPELFKYNSDYIPYDWSIWEELKSYLLNTIAALTPVAWILFALIVGILLVNKIVKEWTRKG